jgi:hypothetical protein
MVFSPYILFSAIALLKLDYQGIQGSPWRAFIDAPLHYAGNIRSEETDLVKGPIHLFGWAFIFYSFIPSNLRRVLASRTHVPMMWNSFSLMSGFRLYVPDPSHWVPVPQNYLRKSARSAGTPFIVQLLRQSAPTTKISAELIIFTMPSGS